MEDINEKELTFFEGWVILMGQFFFVTLMFLFSNPLLLGFSVFILIFLSSGFFINPPNEALVGTLFGKYKGSLKQNGFFWINPFIKKNKISVKLHNLSSQQIKLNDKIGSPLEVGANFSWRINDTAKALFAIEHYELLLANQIDSALRKVVSNYNYETDMVSNELCLKNNIEEINKILKDTVAKFTCFAGIEIFDARFTHLSYIPEFAQVMLKRKQAEVIISARKKIVEGSINIINDLLIEIDDLELANFSNDDKVHLIINLMTILISDKEIIPTIEIN